VVSIHLFYPKWDRINSTAWIRCLWDAPSAFARFSLWGKFGGLYACGATFPYIVPLANNFLTHMFSKLRLKRKDFQKVARLDWAREVWSSNLHAPTNYFFVFNSIWLTPTESEPELGSIWVQIQVSRRSLPRDAALPGSRANKSRA
jgi:hypothetical protein